MICPSCQKDTGLVEKPGFRTECPHCSADLHCCKACTFYDTSAYNECRESSADRVLEKDRANFCEYFSVRENSAADKPDPAAEARKKLENLFKK